MPITTIGHEAFYLNSIQYRLFHVDDFLGDQVQDEWDQTINGVGSAIAVVDGETGGVCRLTAGPGPGRNSWLDWNDIRSLLVSKEVAIEFRCKLSSVINARAHLGLNYDGNDHVRFDFDTSDTGPNWMIVCTSAGVRTRLDSGIAADTSYHLYRIECHTHGGLHAHFFIDGVEVENSPLTTNVTTNHLQPFIMCLSNEAASKQLDLDYVAIRQDR